MPNKKRELPTGCRHAAFILLSLERKDDNQHELNRGALPKVAKIFSCDRSTMWQFWREMNMKLEHFGLTDKEVYMEEWFFKNNNEALEYLGLNE